MADVPVVEPAASEVPDRGILDRVLHPAPQAEAVQVSEDECPNCANNGNVSKLGKDFTCPTCGYEAPVQTRPTQTTGYNGGNLYKGESR